MGRGGGEHRFVQQIVGQRAGGGVDAGDADRVLQAGISDRSVPARRIGCGEFVQQREIGLEHGLEHAGGNSASGASQSMPRPPSSS